MCWYLFRQSERRFVHNSDIDQQCQLGGQKKNPAQSGGVHQIRLAARSALAGFEPALGLVDHVYAAFAAHDPAIAVPVLQRTERVLDLHQSSPLFSRRGPAPLGWRVFRANRNS